MKALHIVPALTILFVATQTSATHRAFNQPIRPYQQRGPQKKPCMMPGTDVEMRWIPEGNFKMGYGNGQANNGNVEHEVHLSGFWLATTPITRAQFRRYCKEKLNKTLEEVLPATIFRQSDEDPVVCITWERAKKYCDWAGGSLPTEAQWEYAARGPGNFKYPWGNEFRDDEDRLQWSSHGMGSAGGTSPVDDKRHKLGHSPFGCLDMVGNVNQWCSDWYANLSDAKASDPSGPTAGRDKVLRGGGWIYYIPYQLRCDQRYHYPPTDDVIFNNVGFRLACKRDDPNWKHLNIPPGFTRHESHP